MGIEIRDPNEIKLVSAYRRALQQNGRKIARRGGGGTCPPFFMLIRGVPIGKRQYKVICHLVEEPLPETAVRDVDRYK